MEALLGWLSSFWGFLQSLGQWMVDGVVSMVAQLIYWVLEALFSAVIKVVETLDLSAQLTTHFGDWSGIPAQTIYLVNALNIPQVVTILLAAIGVRMILNLIPASLTRV